MVNSALIVLSAAASESAEAGEAAKTSPYLYGGIALGTLLLLLFLVTRINIDR
jgi:hypothetical protein